MTDLANNSHYLLPGNLFAHQEEYTVLTVLGSCISVCLWDPRRRIGGINHYMLPFWNGEGLASPRFGNIAIIKLLERMLELGADRRSLQAKVFGGGDMLKATSALMNIGQRNIVLAQDLLRDERIPIVSADTGGKHGRKLLFNTQTGVVLVKLLIKQIDDIHI
ncbi:MAG: chemotaxis protein CheD [Nitrospirae bacterium GWD2_57_9]|nr:MAG: chemotaxis protein CheD [Nitrospirae bacterium GWD2_57_9]OGW47881.1 MAG: chemotaxis protein CheD [Nitrospirae bacterium GWC2_57_9]